MKKKRSGKLYWVFGVSTGLAIIALLLYPLLVSLQHKEEQRTPRSPAEAVIKRSPNPEMTKLIAEFETEITRLMNKTGLPGAAIAIVKDSVVVYSKGFGYRSVNGRERVDENSVFRIASVSKCFASFLTGIMVEDNKLSWDDPIVRHLPEFELIDPDQTDQLTVTHVLSHTTGLPYHTYTNMVEEGIDLPTLLSKLKEVKMSNKVGREYSYQNVAYSLIGEVIGRTTGSTYESEMIEKVFQPLGMKNASMNYQAFVSNENIAKPHRQARRRWVETKINNTYYNVAPAGGINASISDMGRWMVALLGYREDVIRKSTLSHMYAPAIGARSKNKNYVRMQRGGKSFYGLGWRILHYPSDTLIYHGGYVTGYRSEVALNPDENIAVCILANAPGELPDTAIPRFFTLYRKYREKIAAWETSQRQNQPL